jgi:hybrid cluster-associated redox disulfide protein
MIIEDVLKKVPGAVKVFVDNGVPCVGWGAALYETVEQGARAHGINPDRLVDALNKLAGEGANH